MSKRTFVDDNDDDELAPVLHAMVRAVKSMADPVPGAPLNIADQARVRDIDTLIKQAERVMGAK